MAGVYGGMKRICCLCGEGIRVDNPGMVLKSPDWQNGRPIEAHRSCSYAAIVTMARRLRAGDELINLLGAGLLDVGGRHRANCRCLLCAGVVKGVG